MIEVDGDGALTRYVYDANAQLFCTAAYATPVAASDLAALAAGTETSATLLAHQQSANTDRCNWLLYDATGRIAATVDADQYLTEYQYDDAKPMVAQVLCGHALSGRNSRSAGLHKHFGGR